MYINQLSAFLGRHHRVSIPKLFDNRQVINNSMESKIVTLTSSSSSSSTEDDYLGQSKKRLHTQDELVYLSFHGF
jgi:hypothetical protein